MTSKTVVFFAAIFLTKTTFAGQIPLGKITCVIKELRSLEMKDGKLQKGVISSRSDHEQTGDEYNIEFGIESTKRTIYVKVGNLLLDTLEAKRIPDLLRPNHILLRDSLGSHWGELLLGNYSLDVRFPGDHKLKLQGYDIKMIDYLVPTRFSGLEVSNTNSLLEYRALDCSVVKHGFLDLRDYTAPPNRN